MENINPDLFEDYDRLVTIKIEDRQFQVPENSNLLRALQFLGISLLNAKLCWNGECENCLFAFTEGDNNDVKRALACRQLIFDGMVIDQLPRGINLKSG